jgi:hypothetical protein
MSFDDGRYSLGFKERAILITAFVRRFRDDERLIPFKTKNDIGVPLAMLLANDLVTMNEGDAILHLDYTWDEVCNLIGCNPDAIYETIEDMAKSAYRSPKKD